MRTSCAEKHSAPMWLLVLITMSGTLGMHMFVPALPDAARSLKVDSSTMQMAISIYIMGLAWGQLIYGPLADSLGRRPMLLLGLGLYNVSSVLALCAPSIGVLLLARLCQALGGCAGLALGRTIVRDTTESAEALRALALLNFMMMIGPGLAPLLGSGLVLLGGWRIIFVVLTGMGVVTLASSWYLIPETGTPAGKIHVGTFATSYLSLLRSPSFLGYSIGGGCATTSIYAFIATAPFIVTEKLHLPLHEVGIFLGVLITGMSLGNVLTRRLALPSRTVRLLILGNALSILCAAIFFCMAVTDKTGVISTGVLMFLFAFGAGVTSPAALSRALDTDARLIGSAAGLYGFIQMMAGSLCSFLASLGSDPALASAGVLLGAAAIGQTGFWCSLTWERRSAKQI